MSNVHHQLLPFSPRAPPPFWNFERKKKQVLLYLGLGMALGGAQHLTTSNHDAAVGKPLADIPPLQTPSLWFCVIDFVHCQKQTCLRWII